MLIKYHKIKIPKIKISQNYKPLSIIINNAQKMVNIKFI